MSQKSDIIGTRRVATLGELRNLLASFPDDRRIFATNEDADVEVRFTWDISVGDAIEFHPAPEDGQ